MKIGNTMKNSIWVLAKNVSSFSRCSQTSGFDILHFKDDQTILVKGFEEKEMRQYLYAIVSEELSINQMQTGRILEQTDESFVLIDGAATLYYIPLRPRASLVQESDIIHFIEGERFSLYSDGIHLDSILFDKQLYPAAHQEELDPSEYSEEEYEVLSSYSNNLLPKKWCYLLNNNLKKSHGVWYISSFNNSYFLVFYLSERMITIVILIEKIDSKNQLLEGFIVNSGLIKENKISLYSAYLKKA